MTGDLNDEPSIIKALRGIDVVISTANGVVPQAGGGHAGDVNGRALRLIELCEQAGVKRFVQSSVPPFKHEDRVPELKGKRMIEARLQRSSMQTFIVRNPAFMKSSLSTAVLSKRQTSPLMPLRRVNMGLARCGSR